MMPRARTESGSEHRPAALETTVSLLDKIRSGDEGARDRLLRRFLPVLRRWAHGRLPAPARGMTDTDDLVQVSLLRALGRLEQFEPGHEGAFLSYLHRILQNCVRDEIRRAKRRPSHEPVCDVPEAELPQSAQTQGIEAYSRALETLSEEQRQAVVLRVEFGLSYPEIARMLGRRSGNSVRMQVTRALARLGGTLIVEAPAEPAPSARPPRGRAREERALFRWGSLDVIEKVGAGGFGEVYRAFDTILAREVALKLRRVEGGAEAERFEIHLEEARRLARVRHPNVLAVYGAAIHDGRAGMWTDFIRGQTLEEILAHAGPFAAAEFVRCGTELCEALAAVHEAGLVHGDVKAANAMRDADGRTILMDFGAGSSREDAVADGVQGTPLAMAPELFGGDAPSVASDVYALGALLYRVSSGRYPIAAETWPELRDAVRNATIVPLAEIRPDLPPALAGIIERALARDPRERPASARQFGWMLAAAAEATPAAAAGDSASGQPAGLPVFTTRFVGRDDDIAAVRRLLLDPGLVTLVGSGGSGKTRLAHLLAREVAPAMPDGVHWIDLAPIRHGDLVTGTAARHFGVIEDAAATAEEQLLEKLEPRKALLILDNCEHLAEACAAFARTVLDACPDLRLLATSREPFHLPRERTHRVGPLPVPPPGAADLTISRFESVRLFVDRAWRRRPDFVLTAENAPHVARIVRRLDGLPLAIELAAARTGSLGAETIGSKLEESFRVLSDRDAADERHRTINGSIEWSAGLLSDEERTLLARLSVFEGGWTLDAAEEICADPHDAGARGSVGGEEIVDLLGGLVEKSLVQLAVESRTGPRYRMLQMIRAFAAEKLTVEGAARALRERHLAYFLRFAEERDSALFGPDQEKHHALLESEVDNIRAALEECRAPAAPGPGDPERGLRLCMAMRRFWYTRGYLREGVRHYETHLGTPGVSDLRRGRALVGQASLSLACGDLEEARRRCYKALEIQRRAEDAVWIPKCLLTLGSIATRLRRVEEARPLLEEAIALLRASQTKLGLAVALSNLGVLVGTMGNPAEAKVHYEEALALFRELDDQVDTAVALRNLSCTALEMGDLPRARALAEESVALVRDSAHRSNHAAVLINMGDVALAEGRLDAARTALATALEFFKSEGKLFDTAEAIESLALLAGASGDDERAARLLASAEMLRLKIRTPLPESRRTRIAPQIEAIRARLGESRYERLRAEGAAMPVERSIAEALGEQPPGA